jgi:large subunit ribosomal protein L10
MTREEKGALIEELSDKLKNTEYFYVTDTGGMTVAQINKFREECYKSGIEYRIVKNTLIRKALEQQDTDLSDLYQILEGTSGIMFSPEDAKTPAKLLIDFKKKNPNKIEKPRFKGASIDSAVYVGEDSLTALKEIRSREEVLGDVIALLQSPAKNTITLLQSPMKNLMAQVQSTPQKLSGIVKALEERAQ